MKIEDLFKFGVTATDGKNAGKRLRVVSVDEGGVSVKDWETGQFVSPLRHGEYSVWQPPKTLFEDNIYVKPTWGNLKKAVEEAGLSDDTPFVIEPFDGLAYGFSLASFSIRELRDAHDKLKKCILVQ